jgi:hypothetical protein
LTAALWSTSALLCEFQRRAARAMRVFVQEREEQGAQLAPKKRQSLKRMIHTIRQVIAQTAEHWHLDRDECC